MNITRKSDLSGKIRTLDLPITIDQILAWNGGKLIQDAFPHLDSNQREFLMTGISPEEWDKAFGIEDVTGPGANGSGVDFEEVTAIMRRSIER